MSLAVSLVWLGAPAVVLGLAALAAALFALHRLRVRHRELEVATTLFWREAIEETRARVLRQRFRHPWTYALLLAIASLLWLGAAGPRFDRDERQATAIVVDASAATGDRWAAALRLARDRAAELPRSSTRVLLAGARVDTVLAPDEPVALLDARIAGRSFDECPPSVERALLSLGSAPRPAGGLAIEIVGDAPVSASALALLPDDVRVFRAAIAPRAAGNAGIVGLGFAESASGAWDRVDVCVETWSAGGATAPQLAIDGRPLELADPVADGERTRWIARDVEARGGRVEASLRGGDAFAADDRAAIVLPNRVRLRVRVGADLPDALHLALQSDPGIELVSEGDGDVVVRREGDAIGGSAPALEISSDGSGASGASGPAFLLRGPIEGGAGPALERAFLDLGLGDVDSTAAWSDAAQRAGRPIEIALEAATTRSIRVWSPLVESGFDFAGSRAFPLFVARAMRWLAGPEPTAAAWAAAGSTAPIARLRDGAGIQLDPAGDELRLPRAGDFAADDGAIVHASLLDLASSRGAGAAATLPAPETAIRAGGGDLAPWLALAALALLVLEWSLWRAGRIP